MAAHVYTAICQIVDNGVTSDATSAPWTNELDYEDYVSLQQVSEISPDATKGWAIALRNKYREKWFALNMPKTREEWLERTDNTCEICGGTGVVSFEYSGTIPLGEQCTTCGGTGHTA